jgi:translocation and assembly module TamB
VLGADLDIDGTGDEKSLPLLSGRIDVVHLLLRDAAGPRVKRSGVEQPTKALTAERPGEPRVRLDLRIVDHGDVRLEMNLLKGNVTLSRRGQPFRVIGTDVRPALLGTVLIEERSKLTVRNTEFEVERGALRFFDPEKVEARLDVVAAANRRDWHIRLYATGTLSEPRVRFASEPPLSDEDVFMLLSVGMTSAEARQRNRGGVAAEVLWKTAAGGKVARELFPELDVFKVTTEYSPRTGRTEPRIRVGRPLGKNARIDAARGLTAERDLEAVIRYELGRVFSFEGSYRRDPDSAVGDVGIDFGVRTEF